MTDTSRFISFEGGERMGKTTQISLLADRLRACGHEVVVTREPGGTPLGKVLREAIQQEKADTHSHVAVRAEVLMYLADRAQHIETVVIPALERGAYVITDRFEDSSVAYQSAGRGLPADLIRQMSRWASQDLRPDKVLIMDGSLDLSERRRGEQQKLDRMESAGQEFHQRVRQAFLDIAKDDPSRYVVIDADGDRDEVHKRIVTAVGMQA